MIETDGDDLVILDARTMRATGRVPHPDHLSNARGGAVHCANHRCAVLLADAVGEHHWIAMVDGNSLAPPIPIDTGGLFALDADGRRIAWRGLRTVAGLRSSIWRPVVTSRGPRLRRSVTSSSTEVVRRRICWVTTNCALHDTHLFRFPPGQPPLDLFTAHGWVAGIAVEPDGTPLVGVRQFSSNAVLIEGP